MKKVLSVFVAITILLVAGQAMAKKVVTPESLDGVTIVNAEWVKKNMGKVMVFDARKKAEYAESHIPGSISAPYNEKSAKKTDFDPSMDKWDMSVYPKEKNTPIVIYCNGVKCWKSYKSATRLIKAGYTNINWLREGFPGWTSRGYATE